MNNWFAAAAAGVLSVFGALGGHDAINASTSHDFGNGTTTHKEQRDTRFGSTTPPTINISCISAAVATREASIDAAVATYTAGINTAYTTRASALASAYGLTGNDAIRAAVKAAWSSFSSAVKGTRSAWQKSRASAWQTFRTAIKACGPSATAVADTANTGSEVSGQ
jgi:hypothetical protein